jgi:hypothetical protein
VEKEAKKAAKVAKFEAKKDKQVDRAWGDCINWTRKLPRLQEQSQRKPRRRRRMPNSRI